MSKSNDIARALQFVARDVFAEANSLALYDSMSSHGARQMRVSLRRLGWLIDQLGAERSRLIHELDSEDTL